MEKEKTVIVIGAGIKGLYISNDLCKLGFQVTTLERSSSAGGKLKTFRPQDCRRSNVYVECQL